LCSLCSLQSLTRTPPFATTPTHILVLEHPRLCTHGDKCTTFQPCRWSSSPSLSSGYYPNTQYTFTITNPNARLIMGSQGNLAGSWTGGEGSCSKGSATGGCGQTQCRGVFGTGTPQFTWTSPSSNTDPVTIGVSRLCRQRQVCCFVRCVCHTNTHVNRKHGMHGPAAPEHIDVGGFARP
jgi:hypothetical protein